MEENKRKFKFYMTDEFDNEYELSLAIDDYSDVRESELEFILDQFKSFLAAFGYSKDQLSHIQCLDDEEWKKLLTSYGEWNQGYEEVYQLRKSDIL